MLRNSIAGILASPDQLCTVEMRAELGSTPQTPDDVRLAEVLDTFSEGELVSVPSVVLLDSDDTRLILNAKTDGRGSPDELRTLIGFKLGKIKPEWRNPSYCKTAEAGVFPVDEKNFIGFELDNNGKRLVIARRLNILKYFGVPEGMAGGIKGTPHISLGHTEDPNYARYLAGSFGSASMIVRLHPAETGEEPAF